MAALVLGSGLSFLYIANIAYWWSDGSPPSRYLVGGIPLFVAAVAGGWEVILGGTGLRMPLRWLASAAVILSAAAVYLLAMHPSHRYDVVGEIRATGSSGKLFGGLEQYVEIDPGQLFPSLVVPDLTALALALPWLALALALIWIGRRSAPAT